MYFRYCIWGLECPTVAGEAKLSTEDWWGAELWIRA